MIVSMQEQIIHPSDIRSYVIEHGERFHAQQEHLTQLLALVPSEYRTKSVVDFSSKSDKKTVGIRS